jgi:hypothetical protein
VQPPERARLESFVKPLYQDLDGLSRYGDMERVAAIARRLYSPADPEDIRQFEWMILLHGLTSWLGRVGNLSRMALATGIAETELRGAAAALQGLATPADPAVVAIASALRIDEAGLRGLTASIAAARREGRSILDLAREERQNASLPPEWMPDSARAWFGARAVRRRRYCEELLREIDLSDLD